MIGAGRALRRDRRRRRGDEDRRRRRRRRPDEPVLRPGRLRVPGRLPEGRQEVDDAEGDRRARLPRPGLRTTRPALALDPEASFHGTHVAGIAAGDAGTTCARRRRPPGDVRGYPVSRRARRSATTGSSTSRRRWRPRTRNTPEIVAAFEAAVARRHGRDQLLGRRPAGRSGERRDDRGGPERRRRRRRARDLGRQRPRRLRPRLASARPATRRTRSRLPRSPTSHVYGPALTVTGAGRCRPAEPRPVRPHGRDTAGLGERRPAARRRRHDHGHEQRSGAPRSAAGRPGTLERRASPLPAGSLNGAIALVSRGDLHVRARRPSACSAAGRDRDRPRRQPARRGERRPDPARRPERDDLRLRRLRACASYLATSRRTHGDPGQPGSARSSTPSRSGIVTSFSSGGLTALRPPAEAGRRRAGRPDPLGHARELRWPLRRLRRNEHGCAARRRRRRACCSSTIRAGRRARSSRRSYPPLRPPGRTRRARSRRRCSRRGSGLINCRHRERPEALHGSGVALLRGPERDPRSRARSRSCSRSRTRATGPERGPIEVKPQSSPSGVEIIVPGARSRSPRAATLQVARHGACSRGRRPRRGVRLRCCCAAATSSGRSRTRCSSRGRDSRAGADPAARTGSRRATRARASRAPRRTAIPSAAFGPAANYVGAPVNEDGAEALYRIRIDEPAVSVGAAVVFLTPGSLVHPGCSARRTRTTSGIRGPPVNVSNLTIDFPLDIGAAATVFPHEGATTSRSTRAATSSRDDRSAASISSRAWVGDVRPPLLGLDARTAWRRPTDARPVACSTCGSRASTRYRSWSAMGGRSIGAAAYDPSQRHRGLPAAARTRSLRTGQRRARQRPPRLPGSEERGLGRAMSSSRTHAFALRQHHASSTAPRSPGSRPSRTSAQTAPADLLVIASSTGCARVRCASSTRTRSRSPRIEARHVAAHLLRGVEARRRCARTARRCTAIVTDAKGRQAEAQRVVRVCK